MPEPAPSYTYATGCVCSLCLTERLAQAQAALDRIAGVTVEEVAKHLAEWTPDGTVTRIERDMADSVLALVRARVEGRDA